VVADLQGNVIWYCPGNANRSSFLQNGHLQSRSSLDLQEVDLACTLFAMFRKLK